MASLGHVAVGVAAARWRASHGGRASLVRAMLACSVLALLPDVDVVTFRLGIPYGDPFGHRGMTHSLAFAVGVGLAVAAWLKVRGRPVARDALLATLVVASHGVLDACTTGGKGVEFFWPLDTARYFLPWRFIPVAPIGTRMLSMRGLRVVLVEAVLFLPAWLYAFWPRRHPPAAHPLPPVARAG
jgi:inner membrane protein